MRRLKMIGEEYFQIEQLISWLEQVVNFVNEI